MKKIAKATKPQRTLTQQDLAAVLGGHNGTIIVESLVLNGVGGTGKPPGGIIIAPNDTGISGGG